MKADFESLGRRLGEPGAVHNAPFRISAQVVEGKYSLAEVDGDTALLSFSLDRDKEGFAKANKHNKLFF